MSATVRARVGLWFVSLALGFAPQVLAGTPGSVRAELRGTTLRVTGETDIDTELLLTGVPEGGMSAVPAFVHMVPNGTLINGAAAAADFTGVNRIVLSLRNGTNDVTFELLGLLGGISVHGGSGLNELAFNLVVLGENLRVSAGRGPLSFSCMDGEVIGNLFVFGGPESDSISVGCGVDGDAHVWGAGGDDSLQFPAGGFARTFLVSGGSGDDSFTAGAFTERNLRARLGSGANTMAADGLEVSLDLSYSGGGDADTVVLSPVVTGGKTTIHAGGGDNTVVVDDSTSVGQSLSISAGGGNDTVVVGDTSVIQDATLRVGRGLNTIALNNLSVGDDLTVLAGRDDDAITMTGTTVVDQTKIDLGGGTNSGP
jgi:hypothetical protein